MLGLRSARVNCLSGCLDSKGFRYAPAAREPGLAGKRAAGAAESYALENAI